MHSLFAVFRSTTLDRKFGEKGLGAVLNFQPSGIHRLVGAVNHSPLVGSSNPSGAASKIRGLAVPSEFKIGFGATVGQPTAPCCNLIEEFISSIIDLFDRPHKLDWRQDGAVPMNADCAVNGR